MLSPIGFLLGLAMIVGGQIALIVVVSRVNADVGGQLAHLSILGLFTPFLGLIVALMFLINTPKVAAIPFGVIVGGYVIVCASLSWMTFVGW